MPRSHQKWPFPNWT
ncbi:hypothetical protein F383_36227 [Gossypium arboreum]|uniref:Uncharacterized protein n=1 Tax=Gossypium arboreum TaxID=29729 RepID=A0A0B0N7W8_GOSAR|nr:hypothetical protein F383_36227 [Gossypium arboreum]